MTARPTDYMGHEPAATTDRITLVPGQYTPSSVLRRDSALAGCTKIDVNGEGRVYIARNWPTLSRGEELLWSLLAWLNGDGPRPDLDDLRAGLDADNYAAARAAVGA